MRKATICLLVVLFASCTSSFGQSAAAKNKKNYPQIVAKVHLTGQTAPIPLTTLLVPKKDGLYRVSAYVAATKLSGGQNFGLNMTWTDDLGAESSGDVCPFDGISRLAVWSTTMKVNANTPLSYAVPGSTQCKGITTYEVFFTVERLE